MVSLLPNGARSASTTEILASAVLAFAGAATAQGLHPFAAPKSIPAFSLGGTAAVLDYNRDASPDLVVPSVFFGTLLNALDEDGAALATNVNGPIQAVPGSAQFVTALAMAGGDVDRDGLQDLVTVTSVGTVNLQRNLGSQRLGAGAFAPDVIIDNFAAVCPVNPPLISYWFPVVEIVDLDHDGFQDIVVGGSAIDRWSGLTTPGFVGYYRGDGTGSFTIHRHMLAGTVVDLEIADLDANGVHDRVVVLTEQGGAGAFTQDLVHLSFSGGQLFATNPAQNVSPGRFTALEMADVLGDGNADYVLAQVTPSSGMLTSAVMWFQGDGAGNVVTGNWGNFLLPPNPTTLQEFIPAVEVGDWNRDGHVDLAVLRGFVQPVNSMSNVQPTYADSELLVAMGPNLMFASFGAIALPGAHSWSSSYNQLFPLLPLFAAPGFLRQIDLHLDGSRDLVVLGMRGMNGTAATTTVATLANTTPGTLGDTRFEKIGVPSGGLAARPARLGFDGGRAKPGNQGFGCTVQNVQSGSLVGLVWGLQGYPSLFQSHGIDAHLIPMEYLTAGVAAGAGANDGFFRQPLAIPSLPALIGDAGYFQAVYFDHVSGTFGGSHATGVSIGQ